MSRLHRSLVAVLVVCIVSLFQLCCARHIDVELKAAWPKYLTSAIAETAEFVDDSGHKHLWGFVNNMCQHSEKIEAAKSLDTAENRADILSITLEAASSTLPKSVLTIMDTSIGIGTYTPAVRFHQVMASSYGNPCNGNSFVVAYPQDKVFCDMESFNKWTETENNSSEPYSSSNVLFGYFDPSWEHIHRDNSRNKVQEVALHGIIGTNSFCKWHHSLSELSNAGSIQYAIRHSFAGEIEIEKDTNLQGFGVFLDIKNMEYKTIDDSKQSSSSNDKATELSSFVEGEEVAGIDFSKISKRKPALTEDLKILRDRLLSFDETNDSSMKLWKMKDLGIQTLQAIRASTNPLNKLSDISQNFPMHANALSSMKVNNDIKNSLLMYYETGGNQFHPNSIYINGLRIDLGANTFNIYDVLREIRKELGQLELYESLNNDRFPTSLIKEMKSMAVKVEATGNGHRVAGHEDSEDSESDISFRNALSETIRIDVSKGGKFVVNFINNLEKDQMYKRWPRTLRQLLTPSWGMHSVARNMYTCIANVDPLTEDGAYLMMQLKGFWQQMYPIRFGFVLDCKEDRQGSSDVSSMDVCMLFAYLRDNSMEMAHEFLFELSERQLPDESSSSSPQSKAIRKMDVLEVFASVHNTVSSDVRHPAMQDAKAILDRTHAQTEYWLQFAHNSTAYLENRGLVSPSYSFNGIIMQGSSMQSGLSQNIGREQFLLSQMVMTGAISDKSKSLFNSILGVTGSFPRYHPMLDERRPAYVDISAFHGNNNAKVRYHSNDFMQLDDASSSSSSLSSSREGMGVTFANTTVMVFPTTRVGIANALSAVDYALSSEVSRGSLRVGLVPIPTPLVTSGSGHEGEGVCNAPFAISDDQIRDLALLALQHVCDDSMDNCHMESLQSLKRVFSVLSSADSTADTVYSTLLEVLGDRPDFVSALEDVKSCAPNRKMMETHTRTADVWRSSLGLEQDQSAIVYNGRVVTSHAFHELDLSLLSTLEYKRFGEPLFQAIQASTEKVNLNSDDALLAFCVMGRHSTTTSEGFKTQSKRIDIVGNLRAMQVISDSSEIPEHFPNAIFVRPEESHDGEHSESRGMSIAEVFDASDVQLVYFMDPLSMAGQRGSALATLIQRSLKLPQLVMLTPQLEYNEFPLQSFYRGVAAVSSQHAKASFRSLPRQHVLTVRTDVPEAWNVQAFMAEQDIDNLKCDSSQCGDSNASIKDMTKVGYVLKNLLVAGQCFDTTPRPPNGLQLTLTPVMSQMPSTDTQYKESGTIVMQNLGYYQLQANPGLWRLELAQGKPREIFTIQGTEQTMGRRYIPVRSFSDKIHSLTVKRNEGFENAKLYDDIDDRNVMRKAKRNHRKEKDDKAKKEKEASSSGSGSSGSSSTEDKGKSAWDNVLGTLSSMFKGSQSDDASTATTTSTSSSTSSSASSSSGSSSSEESVVTSNEVNEVNGVNGVQKHEDDDKIHVFSLATGHVYERLLRIMMLSVSRRTSKPVKFWLFENYLSPTFKQLAEAMATKYGFEVAYVTYKWPEWLTQQTQKQRIIWGYKILFLDVLFPLHLKKVIYVDADQVLRADLNELWTLDLEGHPYGYTPFCSSRQETLGFQFWRSGYWADHLRGKPYHISALYVVDLQVFRRMTVGDQLRAIYDGLARDPNSLANLDQDLPNYAQHAVPIFSLPQEWLWCETWCSDETKPMAKTIDLCNNPLHKEPKLAMARRVVSGPLFNESWVELDGEIRELAESKGFIGAQ